MDILDRPVISSSDTKHYRCHSTALELALVEQTLQPGAFVARIAREHGVNADQVFGWRKLHRKGLLDSSADASAAMLPVTIMAPDSQGRDSLVPPSQSRKRQASFASNGRGAASSSKAYPTAAFLTVCWIACCDDWSAGGHTRMAGRRV